MKVLVVDDHDINRKLPMAILGRLGVAVDEAASGPEALEKMAADGAIGHVLLDVSMPGMSGLEVCAALRARADGRALRIVAYTAHAFPGEKQKIMAAGFDELLIKPINREALLKALGID
jgi:CheY-like chemotaxis protein